MINPFKLYLKESQEQVSPTWNQVRDTLQMKKPFAILVFRTRSSYLQYLEDTKDADTLIKQIASLDREGQKIKYPSVFLVLGTDADFSDQAHQLFEKYDIKQIVAGQANVEYATLYLPDGSSSQLGNEIVSTLSPDELQDDEYFKIGSTYYKFIDFAG